MSSCVKNFRFTQNLHEMRDFLRSFGTNPLLQDKTIPISFCPPSEFARTHKADSILSPFSAPTARGRFGLSEPEVSNCGLILSFALTFFQNLSGEVTMNSVTPDRP